MGGECIAGKPWSPDEGVRLDQLLRDGFSPKKIFLSGQLPGRTLSSIQEMTAVRGGLRRVIEKETLAKLDSQKFGSFDAQWKHFKSLIGDTSKETKKKVPPRNKVERIACFPDLHIPYHDERLLARAIREAKSEGCKVAVQGGDLFDAYSQSRFIRYTDSHSLLDEFKLAKLVIQTLSSEFDEVILLLGNHPDRVRKNFLTKMGPETLFLYNWNIPGSIAKEFGNVTATSHTTPGGETIYYVYQRGDCLFTHCEKYSKSEMQAGKSVALWFEDWQKDLGLSPFRVVVQFHIHSMGMVPVKGKFFVVEAGCLCQTQGYSIDGKARYKPQDQGWTLIHQERGRTDVNQSRPFFYSL